MVPKREFQYGYYRNNEEIQHFDTSLLHFSRNISNHL
jgi:hypothetical protein